MTRGIRGLISAVGLLLVTGWALADGRAPAWQTRTVVQRGSARVRIAGGWFDMGSDDAELARARELCGTDCQKAELEAETPRHRVYVRAFEIDETEVSNAAHQRCVDAGRCLPPRPAEHDALPELPVVLLTFGEAREFCRFAGGDLPSEAQWELAAHGSSRRSFPWGERFEPGRATFAGAEPLSPVTAHLAGRSFYGLLNMAGNVWERVLDRFAAPYPAELPTVDPVHGEDDISVERVMRGGSYRSAKVALRARARAAIREDEARADVGLRCAYPDRK
jgi:formylglycine-generating enzyme required for sulfatase activity